MAIDWNKEITLGGSGQMVLPTKTTMNLLPQQTSSVNVGKIVLWVVLGLLLAALVGKFGIADRLAAVGDTQAKVDSAQHELDDKLAKLADFEDVQAEYRSYTGNGSEDSGIDALRAMELVATAIEPSATVTAAGSSGNMLTVGVKDISLDAVGRLADTLRAQPIVENVVVIKADSSDESNVTAMLQITLDPTAEEGR